MKPPAVDTTPAVLFADLDGFYASAEQMDRPDWRGRPLVVVHREAGRGVGIRFEGLTPAQHETPADSLTRVETRVGVLKQPW